MLRWIYDLIHIIIYSILLKNIFLNFAILDVTHIDTIVRNEGVLLVAILVDEWVEVQLYREIRQSIIVNIGE